MKLCITFVVSERNKAMTYPSATAAPSIETLFVNGFKFDICELDKSAYNMIADKKFRFFLCCEDQIIGIDSANKYFEKTGDVRWDLFCFSKSDCMDRINKVQSDLETIQKWIGKTGFLAEKMVKDLTKKNQNLYGIKLTH